MDCILNELSLNGQFSTIQNFVESGVKPIVDVMNDMVKCGVALLYKKSTFYSCFVTSDKNFYDVIFGDCSRQNDEIRRFKNKLARLQNEPYWDSIPKQDSNVDYLWEKRVGEIVNVNNTALAEVYARKMYLISFTHDDFIGRKVKVKEKDKEFLEIPNIWAGGQLQDELFNSGQLRLSDYLPSKFARKLNFSELKQKDGFDNITKANLNLFLDSFRMFENKSWQGIFTDDGLEFKEFHQNRKTKNFFSAKYWSKGIYKFRVNDKIRCFGYKSNGLFYLLRIDLDHKLSDLG